MLCGMRQHEKCAAQVRADDLVEDLYIPFANRGKRHNSRIVHHHVYITEGLDRFFKKPLHIVRFGDIRLDGDGCSSNPKRI
jgi:hypothetical protein